MTTQNRTTTAFTLAAVMLATIVFGTTSVHADPLSATGWNVDFILGNAETYVGHQKPENSNIWFASGLGITPGPGLAASGSVTAGGVDFQIQPYTGGTNNVVRGPGTLTLDSPGKFSEISVLGSNTGGTAGDPWELVLNFSDGPSSGAIVYPAFGNWAGSGPQLNPQLTSNGTTSGFGGQLNTATFDLTGLGFSGSTLTSIDFSAANGAGGNLAVFGLAGVAAAPAIPEPSSIALMVLGVLGLAIGSRRRKR